MKKLLAILVLSLYIITPSHAEDISDFQIEGMSIGDSLLNYLSESEIKKFKRKTAFKDKTYSRYLIVDHKNHSSKFNALRIYTRTNDKKYIIAHVGGMKQFPNTFDKCLEEKKNLLNDVKLVLGTSKNYKTEKNKKRKRKQDKSGKSYDIITVYQFEDGAQMMASCINWSKKMKYSDMLDLSIMNKEYKEWNLKAYK